MGCTRADLSVRNFGLTIFRSDEFELPPWDWRILINGYADQMLYERGDLVGQLPFADLKKQALINEKAKAADQPPDFSYRVRDGVVGF